jgi:glycosyltransferase A (GT-A) superfamily protein (DUF2064 family)
VTALLVLLEAPEAGVVKPRLAGAVGPLQATRLYRVLVARILAAALEAGFTPTIWFRPLAARAEMLQWLGPTTDLRPQASGPLGARVGAAVAAVGLAAGWLAIVRDCAGVHADLLRDAAEQLLDAPVVVGPASDGGIWLIGARGLMPASVRNLPDAGPGSLAALRESLGRERIAWRELPVLAAVESAADARAARLLT